MRILVAGDPSDVYDPCTFLHWQSIPYRSNHLVHICLQAINTMGAVRACFGAGDSYPTYGSFAYSSPQLIRRSRIVRILIRPAYMTCFTNEGRKIYQESAGKMLKVFGGAIRARGALRGACRIEDWTEYHNCSAKYFG